MAPGDNRLSGLRAMWQQLQLPAGALRERQDNMTSPRKPPAKTAAPAAALNADGQQAVAAFMDALQHPLKAEIAAVLALIRTADPAIAEGIKWNAPSFRLDEWFATLNIRSRDAVQIILHLGAKSRKDVTVRQAIDDPHGMLQWLGKDRATVKFRDSTEIKSRGAAFQAVLRQWITHLE